MEELILMSFMPKANWAFLYVRQDRPTADTAVQDVEYCCRSAVGGAIIVVYWLAMPLTSAVI